MNFDSIIFDMDGTLWDAVDSYCRVWNVTLKEYGIARADVTRPELAALMGLHIDQICRVLAGDIADKADFMNLLAQNERKMMPQLGGILYPDVKTVIPQLARSHKLFMVSNCDAGGLPNFLHFTGLESYFTDTLSFGDNGKDKDVNIRAIIERYGLRQALYVGDTEGDCLNTHRAGIPFAWASWGFGKNVTGADYTLRSINDLLKIC